MASKLGIMSIVFKKVWKGIYYLLEIVLVLKYFHGKEKLNGCNLAASRVE
jgi:hypothetical protein